MPTHRRKWSAEQRRHEEALKRQAANPPADKVQSDKDSKEKDDAS
jgi:hypothetical protein